LAVAVLVLVTAAWLTQVPTLLVGQAQLIGLQGTAELRSAGEQAWRVAEEGARLGEGDLLRVSEGAGELRLCDGTQLKLKAGAELALDTLRSGLFGGSYRISVQQQAGSVEYEVAPLRGLSSGFEAHTPTVRVSVRGTRFVITVETVQETQVTVLQGSVWLESAEESAVLEEREAAIVPAGAPLLRLPTLTPSFTPLPPLSRTVVPPTAEPSRTPTEAPSATVSLATRAPAAPAPAAATRTALPSLTPTVRATTTITTTLAETVTLAAATVTPQAEATVGPDRLEFTGVIEAFPPRLVGTWRIGGRGVLVQASTRIRGTPRVGLQARVECVVSPASNVRQPELVAVHIDIAESQPDPGVRPTPTPTPWWGAVTTVLPPAVQTVVPQLPTLLQPTRFIPPDLFSTLVAWPTEHPIPGRWPTRTPRSRAMDALQPEATRTLAADAGVGPTATPSAANIVRP
jgi:hypothetical protein